MKTIWFVLFLIGSYGVSAQITLIPDESFEWHLVTSGIDTDGILNGQVLTADINEVTTLNFPDPYGLIDLTGIEDFVALRNFNCDNCTIENIDFSNNSELRNFSCSGCDIEHMDFSQNPELLTINAQLNPINSIDVTNCTNLQSINLGNPDNDVGSFPNIDSIDLSSNVSLKRFFCLHCTEVTSYDFSNNPLLEIFWIEFNYNLESLNLQNGNNPILTTAIIDAGEHLLCIQVDDEEAANNNLPPYDSWWVNPNIILSEDCALGWNEFETPQVRISPNPAKHFLIIQNNGQVPIVDITLLDIFGKRIWRKTEDFEQINIAELPRGMYLLSIQTPSGRTTRKILKQ